MRQVTFDEPVVLRLYSPLGCFSVLALIFYRFSPVHWIQDRKNSYMFSYLKSGKKVLWLHPNLFLFGLCGKMIYSLVRYFFESVLQFCWHISLWTHHQWTSNVYEERLGRDLLCSWEITYTPFLETTEDSPYTATLLQIYTISHFYDGLVLYSSVFSLQRNNKEM